MPFKQLLTILALVLSAVLGLNVSPVADTGGR